MQVRTNVKAGTGGDPRIVLNHNQAPVRAGLKVQTNVKAGGLGLNHNEAQVRGLKVRTNVKAGAKASKVDGTG